ERRLLDRCRDEEERVRAARELRQEEERCRMDAETERRLALEVASVLPLPAQKSKPLDNTRSLAQLIHHTPPPPTQPPCDNAKIPLSLLARNYIYLLSRDRRNIALCLLTLLLLFLLRIRPATSPSLTTTSPSLTATSPPPPTTPPPPPTTSPTDAPIADGHLACDTALLRACVEGGFWSADLASASASTSVTEGPKATDLLGRVLAPFVPYEDGVAGWIDGAEGLVGGG
ncbi:hypothetical protein LTR66_017468, partial [Elasticomyces elasticus]